MELGLGRARRAILNENIQALLDGQGSIEDDESEAKGEDVVAIADLQEVANGTLFDCRVSQDLDVSHPPRDKGVERFAI